MKPTFAPDPPRGEHGTDAIAEIFGEISDRVQAGENIDLEEYIAGHPEHAEQLRRLLPTMTALNDLGFCEAAREIAQPDVDQTIDNDVPRSGLKSRVLGDFRILGEIGRGGMGVVYEAEQISLGRKVALKVLPFAAMLNETQLTRFKNESRAAATLKHPNIVSVYFVGVERGVHFYAMELVEGLSLAEVIGQMRNGPWSMPNEEATASGNTDLRAPDSQLNEYRIPDSRSSIDTSVLAHLSTVRTTNPREYFLRVARLGMQVSSALDHAHAHGVIHRDIKPGNLMIDAGGKILVTDFGLARIGTEASMTMSGDLLGTLRYMSPEQALAKRVVVDHRTDIYSLGLTLYELATLRPAFDGSDRQELLRKIAFEEPTLPRSIEPNIPRDLETILLKSAAKDPNARYATVIELADDLQRFVEQRPIQARRTSRLRRTWQWARRNPVVASLVAALAVLLAALAAVGQFSAIRQASLARDRQLYLYVSDMAAVSEAWADGNLVRMEKLLKRHVPQSGEDDLRGFEWRLFKAKLDRLRAAPTIRHGSPISSVAYSKSGKFLATGGLDGSVKIWQAPHAGRLTPMAQFQHDSEVRHVTFSPDEAQVAAACQDGTISIWDRATKRIVHVLREHRKAVTSIKYAPDGLTLASSSEDHDVRLWDASNGSPRWTRSDHGNQVNDVAFSPDGKLLASVGPYDNRTIIWNVENGEPIEQLTEIRRVLYAVTFSPKGRLLAVGGMNYMTTLWDTSTWKMTRRLREVGHTVTSLVFSEDEQWLISGGLDNTACVWDVNSGEIVTKLKGHTENVNAVAVDSNGGACATASDDGTVRLHRLDELNVTPERSAHWMMPLAFTPDGSRLLVGVAPYGVDPGPTPSSVSMIDLLARRKQMLLVDSPATRSLAIDASGDRLVIGGLDEDTGTGRVVIGRLSDWTEARVPTHEGPTVYAVAITPEGRHIATGDFSGAAAIWDTKTLRPKHRLKAQPERALAIAFSPDGGQLAVGHGLRVQGGSEFFNGPVDLKPGRINLWKVATGELQAELGLQEGGTVGLAYSPDGRLLATGGVDERVKLWNPKSGTLEHVLTGHRHWVIALAFSPDGGTLATGGGDGTVRLWNMATKSELAKLDVGIGISSLAFSPDGMTLAVGKTDRRVRFLDASERRLEVLNNEVWGEESGETE